MYKNGISCLYQRYQAFCMNGWVIIVLYEKYSTRWGFHRGDTKNQNRQLIPTGRF